jgi:hypothetical protein
MDLGVVTRRTLDPPAHLWEPSWANKKSVECRYSALFWRVLLNVRRGHECSGADDGADGTSDTSSNRATPNSTLASTQASLLVAQTAACWISLDRNGDFFVSNADSGTMGSYEVLPDGRLAFLGNTSAGPGAKPLDSSPSANYRDLYVLDGNAPQISVFGIGRDAQLSPIGTQALPPLRRSPGCGRVRRGTAEAASPTN